MALYHYHKITDANGTPILDANGNFTWNRHLVAANSANNIIVFSPKIYERPVALTAVLESFKTNIDQIFGHIKYLAKYGTGGGSGSGGGGGQTTGTTALMFVSQTGSTARTSITNSTVTVSDEFTFDVKIQNPDSDTIYYVNVFHEGSSTTYLNRYALRKSNNFTTTLTLTYEDFSKMTSDNYVHCSCMTSEGVSLDPEIYVRFNYVSLTITGQLTQMSQNNRMVIDGSRNYDVIQSRGRQFRVRLGFTPSIAGTVSYNIVIGNNTYTYNGEIARTEFLKQSTQYVTFDIPQDLTTGVSYSVVINARLVTDTGLSVNADTFRFRAQWATADMLIVAYTQNEWSELEGDFADSAFSNGTDINLTANIYGSKLYYPTCYYVFKTYYGRDDEWIPIDDILANEGISYGTLDGFLEAYRNNDKEALNAWKADNLYVNNSDNNVCNANYVLSYNVLESLNEQLGFFNKDASVYNDDGEFVEKETWGEIRVDVYVFAIDGQATMRDSSGNLITVKHIPLNETETEFVPDLTLKSKVIRSSNYIPDFVTGLKDEVSMNNSRFFNLDTVNVGLPADVNSNTLVFRNTQTPSGVEGRVRIPLVLNGVNTKTSGFIAHETFTDHYTALRFSGKSYGNISFNALANIDHTSDEYDITDRDHIIESWLSHDGTQPRWDMFTNGFCIELLFKSDVHPDANGTIFSMGSFDDNHDLITGILVDLEKATFAINGSTVAVATTPITQGEITQLDFVLQFEKKNASSIDTDHATIKIYKNGVRSAFNTTVISHRDATSTTTQPNDANNILPTLQDGMFFGCKGVRTNNLITENFTDVNFYGIRLYKEFLSDFEIIRNWIASKSLLTQSYNPANNRFTPVYSEVNALLRKNFFNSDWTTELWDYANHRAASARVLMTQMTTPRADENNNSYLELPVLVIEESETEASKAAQFYRIVSESEASSIRTSNVDWGDMCHGTMKYYDEEGDVCSISDIGWWIQGSSSLTYRSKNFELYMGSSKTNLNQGDTGDMFNNSEIRANLGESTFEQRFEEQNLRLFTPKPVATDGGKAWLPENRFTLKADMMDSGHANNATIGKWINTSGFMPLNPAQQDEDNPYKDLVKPTLEGFPCLVFIKWNESSGYGWQFLGIYSFNLGRGSYYNLGFKKFHKYELAENANDGSGLDKSNLANWSDPASCTKPSVVSRYLTKKIDTDVFSFECTANEPADAIAFQQPNRELLTHAWDMTYTPETATTAETNAARERLHDFVKEMSFHTELGSNRQKYYYHWNTTDNHIEEYKVYRSVSDPSVYFKSITEMNEGAVADQRTVTVTSLGGGLYRAEDVNGVYRNRWPNGNSVYEDLEESKMTWEEGLLNEEGETTLPSYNLGDGLQDKFLTNTLNAPTKAANQSDSYMHYLSFSRYFVVAMAFGMVDSLGKNLTLRSWDIHSQTIGGQTIYYGTFVPAFYDMDTALGLNNAGADTIDPTAYVDYWYNLITTDSDGNATASTIKVIEEGYPTIMTEDENNNTLIDGNGNPIARWYDKDKKTVLFTIPQNQETAQSRQLINPDYVKYDMPCSQLWHFVRFLPTLAGNLLATDDAFLSYEPLGQWAALRATKDTQGKFSYLFDSEDFVENYYVKQNAAVGEIIFNLDYAEKYEYFDSQSDTYPYRDFCHGTRVDFIRQWLRKRFSFLDGVFNLGHLYSRNDNVNKEATWVLLTSNYATRYYNTTTGINLAPQDVTVNGVITRKSYSVYLNSFADRSRGYDSTAMSNYRQTVTSNTPTVLVINQFNTLYRFFLRPNVATPISLPANTSEEAIVIYSLNSISDWSGIKQFRLEHMESGDWNLYNLDLSNTNSYTTGLPIIGSMTELRTLNLANTSTAADSISFKLDGLYKLRELDLSGSKVKGALTLADGGNLEALNVTNTQIDSLTLNNLTLLASTIRHGTRTTYDNGTLDLSDCTSLTTLTINNCPLIKRIVFGNNRALHTISINDCPGIEELAFNGVSSTGMDTASSSAVDYAANMKSISVTGNCSGMKRVYLSNLHNTTVTINLSGATSLEYLYLEEITNSKELPILPAYTTASPIYNPEYYEDGHKFSIYLRTVKFPALLYGTDENALVKYIIGGTAEYPKPTAVLVPYSDYSDGTVTVSTDGTYTITNGTVTHDSLILNLAVFPSLGSVNISDCPGIEYIATSCNSEDNSFSTNPQYDGAYLNNLKNLKRIFGYLRITNNCFNINIPKFHIAEWNGLSTTDEDNSDVEVKNAFSLMMKDDSTRETYRNTFLDLMNDSRGETAQGIVVRTRLIVDKIITAEGVILDQAFMRTGISANDLYYIMMVLNDYNRNAASDEKITSMVRSFSRCENIITDITEGVDIDINPEDYTYDTDKSPSRFLFKDMSSLRNIQQIFQGCSNMRGILYSPKYDTGQGVELTAMSQIGTLTPLSKNCADFSSIGWGLYLADNYTFWLPGDAEYGNSYKATNLYGFFTGYRCIRNAVEGNGVGYVDVTPTAFKASQLLKYFKNVVTIQNSFDNIQVELDCSTVLGTDGQKYSFTPLLYHNTMLESIISSFNFGLSEGGVFVDPFGGSKAFRNEQGEYNTDSFPQHLGVIKSSFSFSMAQPSEEDISNGLAEHQYAYFAYTDDMLQRIRQDVSVITPSNEDASADGTVCFGGSYVRKTYVKYPNRAGNDSSIAYFPYGMLKGCSALTTAPGLFADMNLRYYVDMTTSTNRTKSLADVIGSEYMISGSYTSVYSNVTIPDFYVSAPYTPQVNIRTGEVLRDASILMFEDTMNLRNFTNGFGNITPPNYQGSTIGNTYGTIPLGIRLTGKSFRNCKNLNMMPYVFSNNHYIIGHIPFGMFYTGDDVMNITVTGTDDATSTAHGMVGLNAQGAEVGGASLASYFGLHTDGDFYIHTVSGDITPREDLVSEVHESGISVGGDRYMYVHDEAAIDSEAYVMEYTKYLDDQNGNSVINVQTTNTSSGVVIPRFRKYNAETDEGQPRYALRRLSWWQSFQPNGDTQGSVSLSSQEISINTPHDSLSDLSHAFYKMDAQGFIFMHQNSSVKTYSHPDLNTVYDMNNADVRTKFFSEEFKLNSYVKNDYMTVKTGGQTLYLNSNLFTDNQSYSPYIWVLNEAYDGRQFIPSGVYHDNNADDVYYRYGYNLGYDNLNNTSETATSGDLMTYKTVITEGYNKGQQDRYNLTARDVRCRGVVVYVPNPDYDPRIVVFNENRNKVTFNKYVYDGIKFTDDSNLISQGGDYILNSGLLDGKLFTASSSTDVKNWLVERHIPGEWKNPNQIVTDPDTYVNAADSSTQDIYGIHIEKSPTDILNTNQLVYLNAIRKDEHFFCPPDIFLYSRRDANVRYAFAEGGYQMAKENANIFNRVYKDYQYYLEGNLYSGLPGRVCPFMFEPLAGATSIEGIFYKNPQLNPYSWGGLDASGNYVMGDLWEKNTFAPLTNCMDFLRLWANNVVPRGVRVNPDTFAKNTQVISVSYMFAGTLFFGYSKDDDAYGGQIPAGIFDSLHISQANATFTPVINHETGYSNDIGLSNVGAVSLNSGTSTFGEQDAIGIYGVRTLPTTLLDNSEAYISQANNFLYYNQAIKNPIVPLWNYPNLFTDKAKSLYHTAFYLSPTTFTETEKDVIYNNFEVTENNRYNNAYVYFSNIFNPDMP